MNGRLGFLEKYGQVHGQAELGKVLGLTPEEQEAAHQLTMKAMKLFGIQVMAAMSHYAKDIGANPGKLFAIVMATICALQQQGALTFTEEK